MKLTRRALSVLAITAIGIPLSGKRASAGVRTPFDASRLVQPGDPIYGNPNGTVTIVDFYDIRCPPCRVLDTEIEKLLEVDHFVRYVPLAYPILGAPSTLGTKALFGAALQGKCKPLRAILMQQVAAPDMAVLQRDAEKVGLDWPRLELEMNDDRIADHVERNLRRGRALGIQGIPTFFIGTRRISGVPSYQKLRSLVAVAEQQAAGHERS